MIKKIFFILFLLITTFEAFSQIKKKIRGQIINNETKKPLADSNILNLNLVIGTTTNEKGLFELTAKPNDTILISYLGFESIKLKVTNDLLKGNQLVIALNEKPQEVKEVVINSTKLIGVLEVDVKMVPKDKFTRIHLNGLPQTYEVGKPQKNSPILDNIFDPIGLLYNFFGKKSKKLKKLKKLKKEDNLRKMLSGKYDREVMMEYLEMDNQELKKLLSDCNFSDYFIKKSSDLQIIEAILNCYENYKAIKKGKIELNRIPDQK